MIFNKVKYQLLPLFVMINGFAYAQNTYDYQNLKLSEAIEIGLKQNKNLKIQSVKSAVFSLKEKDLKNEKLPDVNFHTGLHVLTNLNQFENGIFNGSTPYEVPHTKYDFTLSVEVPIYLGGKLKYEEEKAAVETTMQDLKLKKDERDVRLQIITAYLQALHLQEQQSLISDKMREDSAVIKQTQKLQNNGVVTYNEVLRTKLQLSNHQMSYTELENEVAILEHQIKTILAIPEEEKVFHISTKDLFTSSEHIDSEELLIKTALENSENLHITEREITLKELDKKITRANVLPQITAGGEYLYSYPNMMFFPPVKNMYRIGIIGVDLNLNLSNFYKNRVKMKMADKNIALAKLEVEEKEEQIRHDVYAAQKRLDEADEKIKIAEEAIVQAKENYRIVRLKYSNKLSLITELIDADNAYLEAQSNLISLQINKQLKYYQLQYVLGNL